MPQPSQFSLELDTFLGTAIFFVALTHSRMPSHTSTADCYQHNYTAAAVYLAWLIVTIATGHAPTPIIARALIAAVYDLQAIIFILKREFMLIEWLVIHLIAYALPLLSRAVLTLPLPMVDPTSEGC